MIDQLIIMFPHCFMAILRGILYWINPVAFDRLEDAKPALLLDSTRLLQIGNLLPFDQFACRQVEARYQTSNMCRVGFPPCDG